MDINGELGADSAKCSKIFQAASPNRMFSTKYRASPGHFVTFAPFSDSLLKMYLEMSFCLICFGLLNRRLAVSFLQIFFWVLRRRWTLCFPGKLDNLFGMRIFRVEITPAIRLSCIHNTASRTIFITDMANRAGRPKV